MIDKLENGGFSKEWAGSHDCKVFPVNADPYLTQIGNIFTPPCWIFWYKHGGAFAQPEARDSWAVNDPRRVVSPPKSFMWFTFNKRHDAGLFQQVEVIPGSKLRLSAQFHAWSNHKDAEHPNDFPHPDNPEWSEGAGFESGLWRVGTVPFDTGIPQEDAKANFRFWVGIDPYGFADPYADRVVWSRGWHIYNTFAPIVLGPVDALADVVTVFLRSSNRWPFKHNDAYVDDVVLEVEKPEVITYERTVHLMPQDTTKEELAQVLAIAYPEKQTITWSVDDAVITHPNLATRTLHAWAADRIAGSPADLEAWAQQHYPPLPGIIYHSFDPVSDPDPDPPPQPSPSPAGPLLTLHVQTDIKGLPGFIAAAQPAWVKLVGNAELANTIKHISPDTKVLYRHHVQHHAPFLNHPDPQQAARDFLDQFWGAIEANPIDCVEGLNETIATGDPQGTKRAVAFEVALSNQVAHRSNDLNRSVTACLLNTAVGNPGHGAETKLLLPAAEAAQRNHHYIGYHPYIPVHPKHAQQWLANEGEHHHLRALLSWDPVFTAAGYQVRYLFTEAGACAATPRADARPGAYNPAAGWRNTAALNNDWRAYLDLLLIFEKQITTWNATHNNRAEAIMLFTVGAPYVGWDDFKLWERELNELGAALS